MVEADLSPGMTGKLATRADLTKFMVFIRNMSVMKASVKALLGLTQLGQLRCGLGYTLLEHTSSMRQPVWAVGVGGGVGVGVCVEGVGGGGVGGGGGWGGGWGVGGGDSHSHSLSRNWAARQSCTYWPSMCESA